MSLEYRDKEKDKEIDYQVNGASVPDDKGEKGSSRFKNIAILILFILIFTWLFIDAWKSESLWKFFRLFFSYR